MFADEVLRIAGFAGVDAGRLATLLRAAENAEAMRSDPTAALLAAQDRAEASSHPAPADEEIEPPERER